MRLFIHLLVLAFFISPLQAQQQQPKPKPKTPAKKDTTRLFWYKGGFNRNKPSPELITTTFDTVRYIAATRTLKVTSRNGIGKKYDKMLEELERTPQRMNQMMASISKTMPKAVVPHYARPLKAAFDQVRTDLGDALSNELKLPDTTVFSQAQAVALARANEAVPSGNDLQPHGVASGPNIDEVTGNSYITDVKDLKPVAEVLAYYEKHKNDVITYVPAPPRNDYSYCTPCDSSVESRFQQEYKVFMKEFLGEDERMMHLTWAIMRDAQLAFSEEESNEINGLVYPVMTWILDRTDKKTRLLVQKYIDDPARVRTISMIGLSIGRMQQLLGLGKDDNFYLDVFLRGQLALAKLIEKAIKEYDYSIALNIQMMFSVERQFQLTDSDLPRMTLWDMLNFNQFKMNVDLSAKISGTGYMQLAHVRGDNWFAAMPDENCKLKWVLMGPDKDKLTVKLLAADIRGNGGQAVYVGTKDWEASKPLLRIDFCSGAKDTAELYAFQAKNSQELWAYPKIGTRHLAMMNVVLTGCFVDLARARQKAATINPDKLKQEMMQQYQEFMKNGGKDMMDKSAAQMNPQDVQKMMQLAKAMDAGKKMTELVHSPTIASYLLLPTVHNKSKVIFKERLNGKEVFPENRATEYAWLHVTFEQDPDSPYKGVDILNK